MVRPNEGEEKWLRKLWINPETPEAWERAWQERARPLQLTSGGSRSAAKLDLSGDDRELLRDLQISAD